MSNVTDQISDAYAEIARQGDRTPGDRKRGDWSNQIGYTAAEQASVPDGADLGLGCGNPLGLEQLETGETVLDLGSGAGFDAFLAADRVGADGYVIGVDITLQMLAKARANAESGGYENVEFRQGDLRNLPVDDETIDVVTSNCVISLVPDRPAVYREAFRVLKPGGRLTISDTFVTEDINDLQLDPSIAAVAYLAGADTPGNYLTMVEAAGFSDVTMVELTPVPPDLAFDLSVETTLREALGVPEEVIESAKNSMVSISLTARRP
jgi:SAM-dependent methyltransferase